MKAPGGRQLWVLTLLRPNLAFAQVIEEVTQCHSFSRFLGHASCSVFLILVNKTISMSFPYAGSLACHRASLKSQSMPVQHAEAWTVVALQNTGTIVCSSMLHFNGKAGHSFVLCGDGRACQGDHSPVAETPGLGSAGLTSTMNATVLLARVRTSLPCFYGEYFTKPMGNTPASQTQSRS